MTREDIDKITALKTTVEIIVSTYWPTRIIKSVTIKNIEEKTIFNKEVTLSAKEAKYLCQQLNSLYRDQKNG